MSGIAEAARREQLEAECDAAGVREFYEQILAKEKSVEFAAMLALQSPPGTRNTDRTFQESQRHLMNTMDGHNRHKIYAIAQKAGINTAGKFYTGLGRYHDPKAWASSIDDVRAAAKKMQVDVSGPANFKFSSEEPAPPRRVALAEDVAVGLERKILKAEPALAEKCRKSPQARRELRDRVVATHGRKNR